MDQLHSELLLLIFKQLDSNEMVKVTRVCKTWFDIINENQSPWRSLVLLDRERGLDDSIFDLFDRKSQSTLQTVSIRVSGLYTGEIQSVKAILERSKHSLQYLHLLETTSKMMSVDITSFQDLSWKLPNLVHCVMGHDWDRSPSRIVQNLQSREPSSSLRTLWIPSARFVFPSHLHIIDKVASLHVELPFSSSEWRRILERPAHTLKDLKINLDAGAPPVPQSSLNFPNLRVLQLGFFSQLGSFSGRFPSWLKIPSSSTFIAPTYARLPIDLPSVSTVWVKYLLNIRALEERCPVLAELRIDSGHDPTISQIELRNKSNLLLMLRTRKKHVESEAEVDGVKMIPLKTLVINFHYFTEHEISELKEMPQQVVDSNSIDRFIEVEI